MENVCCVTHIHLYFMFTVHEHKFTALEHKFIALEHKFTALEHKIFVRMAHFIPKASENNEMPQKLFSI